MAMLFCDKSQVAARAGHKSQKLAVSIPGNVLRDIAATSVLVP